MQIKDIMANPEVKKQVEEAQERPGEKIYIKVMTDREASIIYWALLKLQKHLLVDGEEKTKAKDLEEVNKLIGNFRD